jgi:hypothetical protein
MVNKERIIAKRIKRSIRKKMKTEEVKPIRRQGLIITRNQLRELDESLKKSNQELFSSCNMDDSCYADISPLDWRYLVPIINKTKKCSDTWELEI